MAYSVAQAHLESIRWHNQHKDYDMEFAHYRIAEFVDFTQDFADEAEYKLNDLERKVELCKS